ncbi:hypothetical protein [Hydrogenophaga sp. MI9]|uniref:hypothetical protein n=1 Tax=Hydrogenophaga sp. MI9 TaxID=3453719 RepID=UPI003EEA26F0
MQAKLNMQLLNTHSHDSGALGPLAMVVHSFSQPGHYSGLVLRHGRPVGEIAFVVDEKSEAMQLDIDLSASGPRGASAATDCGCHGQAGATASVSPKGHVLFHASTGGGYAVTVTHADGKPVFDSTRLENGDLFAVSLLEPTAYRLENSLSGAKGGIAVSFDEEIARRIRSLETVYVDVQGKKFSSGKIALASTQGLVFRVKDPSRIVITREKPEPTPRGKPGLRWQKPAQTPGPTASAR